jgi:cob(I)alamin adenosyltransferase
LTKIYTKTGDGGKSLLPIGGDSTKMRKSYIGFETLGDIDELNALIGTHFATGLRDVYDAARNLRTIQSQLFGLGAQLATGTQQITEDSIKYLEHEIDLHSCYVEPLKNFIIPNNSAHLMRAVCRRAERHLDAWHEERMEKGHHNTRKDMVEANPQFVNTLPYLHRLSDFFFTLARLSVYEEIVWNPTSE